MKTGQMSEIGPATDMANLDNSSSVFSSSSMEFDTLDTKIAKWALEHSVARKHEMSPSCRPAKRKGQGTDFEIETHDIQHLPGQ